MDVGVRPATLEDAPRIEQLRGEAITEQVDSRGGHIWSRREALWAPPGESETFVGVIDDFVVAYARVGVEALDDGSRLGVVTAIYVEPGAREVAVGEAMLDQVIRWCEAQRCVGVDAHALPGNRQTKNFFETFGFTARLLVVHRKLT